MLLNYILGIGILFLLNNILGLYIFETTDTIGYIILGILGGSMFYGMVVGVGKYNYLQILGGTSGGVLITALLGLLFQSNRFFNVNGGMLERILFRLFYSILAYLMIIFIFRLTYKK